MTPERPLLTVCVPTCNRADLLPRAVASVLAQEDAPDIEILICDDASEDNTPEVASALAKKYPGIRYERSETRLGIYANYTRCVELARGKHICFLSDDDEFTPRSCAARLEALTATPEAIFCWAGHRDCRPDDSTRDKLPKGFPAHESARDFALRTITRGFTHTWNSVMMRADAAKAALPFDEEIFPESDHDFQLRMAASAPPSAKVLRVNKLAVLRHHHAGNTYSRHQAKANSPGESERALWQRRQTRVKIHGDYFFMRRRALEMLAERDPSVRVEASLREAARWLGRSRLRVALAQIKNREFADARETLREAPMVADSPAIWLGAALLTASAWAGMALARD